MKQFFQPPATPVIPDHQLIRRIGEGSYGEIWLAKNVIGTYRAVKIVYRARFETERPYEREFKGIQKFEPISRSHPGLVDILQVGRNDDAGYFYYVMELADDETSSGAVRPDTYSGKTLGKELATRGRLPAMEALRLGQNLAAALAHMHQHGLVHRDIKPANIIFVDGHPKLADIGLVALVTEANTRVGTEGYMPPEGPGSIQADIFSLGKVLYEVSTGQERESFPELPDHLSEFPDSQLVMELNEVVVKACANIPEARYASAEDLQGDLQMVVGGRSVKRLRFVERQLKRVKRVAVAAAVLAVAATIFGFYVAHLHAREKSLLTDAYLKEGGQLLGEGNILGALPFFAEAFRLQRKNADELETHRVRLGSALERSPQLLQFWQTNSGLSDVHFSADGEQLLVAGSRGAWLMNIKSGATGMEFPTEYPVKTAAFSPDGRRVVLAYGNSVTVRDVATGSNYFSIKHGYLFGAAFSPDGETVLVACGANAIVIDAHNGRTKGEPLRGHTNLVTCAAFSPDGVWIVTASRDGTARIWDARTRQTRHILRHGQWISDAAFSPDGRQLVTASSDHTLRVWNIADGSVALPGMEHRGGVSRVRFSPDGHYVISAGLDQTVRIWNARTGRPFASTITLHSAAMHAEFDADARRIAVVGLTGEIKIWRAGPDAPVSVGNAVMSRNGERYITYSSNMFRVWNARDDKPLGPPHNTTGSIVTLQCNTAGNRILVQIRDTRSGSNTVHVFDNDGGRVASFAIPGPDPRWWIDEDGTKLLSATKHEIYLWNASNGELIVGPSTFSHQIVTVAFSPSGRGLALAEKRGQTVFLLDERTGEQLRTPLHVGRIVCSLRFATDSERLLIATSNPGFLPGGAQWWDTRTGEPIGALMQHADGLSDARPSHDGEMIATAGEDNRVRTWNAKTCVAITEPIPLLYPAQSVEFSDDDGWMVTATWFEVQVWNPRTGHSITAPFTDPAYLVRAGFCAGSRRIWIQSYRGLLFWDLPRYAGEPEELIAMAHRLGATIPSNLARDDEAFTLAKLREHCSAKRARTDANLERWRGEQADISESAAVNDWFAAQFYLRRLLQRTPEDGILRARLTNAQEQYEASRTPAPALDRETTP